jgi:hypothetical protein
MDYAAPPAGLDSPVQNYTNPEWMSAKRGLVTYRRALIFRIILAIGGGLIIGIMTASGGLENLDSILWATLLVTVASTALTGWMVLGLIGYAKVPAETGGRGLATIALVIAALGLLVEIYVTYLLGKVVLGGFDSLGELAALGDRSFEMIARLGGLVGFICLVVSLKKVASHVGAYHVRDMISSFVMLIFVIIGIFVAILLLPVPFIALLGGLAVLVLLIVALVKFLRILESLGNAIGGLDVSSVFE